MRLSQAQRRQSSAGGDPAQTAQTAGELAQARRSAGGVFLLFSRHHAFTPFTRRSRVCPARCSARPIPRRSHCPVAPRGAGRVVFGILGFVEAAEQQIDAMHSLVLVRTGR